MGKKKNKKKHGKWDWLKKKVDKLVGKLTNWLAKRPLQFLDECEEVMSSLRLDSRNERGFFFGLDPQDAHHKFIGMRQDTDSHLLVIGGSGSGKSACIAKPSLLTYDGSICAVDVKGELSTEYTRLYRQGKVTRPYTVLDFTDICSLSYDPFYGIDCDGDPNFISKIREIAFTLVPDEPNAREPFWSLSCRTVLTAGLVYYFKLGMSFSQSILLISTEFFGMLETIGKSEDPTMRSMLGGFAGLDPKVTASIRLELQNHINIFTTDPYIAHALRGKREGANCVTWDDLNERHIFLRIPADKIDVWGPVLRLFYTQLCHHLERRPEMHTEEGQQIPQVLLLLDEFPRLGKMPMIEHAMATLRSKKTSICLIVQSVAQLDLIYGRESRCVIMDNAAFQVILGSNDTDSQEYLSCRIGERPAIRFSASTSLEKNADETSGINIQAERVLERRIQPHELGMMDDVIILSPSGFCRVPKIQPGQFPACPPRNHYGTSVAIHSDSKTTVPRSFRNEGARLMPIEERHYYAKEKADAEALAYRKEIDKLCVNIKNMDKHRKFVLGEIVLEHMFQFYGIEPANNREENAKRFAQLHILLSGLSEHPELIAELSRLSK